HQIEALNIENEILDELKQAGSNKTEQELRNLLGCFLFQNDEVFKKIKVLSGGEKSRVALSKTLISDANFLLLDEPTNHLDIQSVNILIQALQQYQGTFVVVSHDRHFISNVANKIWYIKDHEIKEYPGTYEEYEYWRKKNETAEEPLKTARKEEKPRIEKPKNTQNDRDDRLVKQLEKEVAAVEKEVEELETQVKAQEEELAKPSVFG